MLKQYQGCSWSSRQATMLALGMMWESTDLGVVRAMGALEGSCRKSVLGHDKKARDRALIFIRFTRGRGTSKRG